MEGNYNTHATFSSLSIEVLINDASDMGISVDNNDFATFDLLKTLELARNDMYLKQCTKTDAISEVNPVTESEQGDLPSLEWME